MLEKTLEKTREKPETNSLAADPWGDLIAALKKRDPSFWPLLADLSKSATAVDEILRLHGFRRKAQDIPRATSTTNLRVALLGGVTFRPLDQILAQKLLGENIEVQCWTGDYDNYMAEILDPESSLAEFRPELILLIPQQRRGNYLGSVIDADADVEKQASQAAGELLSLSQKAWERFGAEVLLGNFIPPADHDIGSLRYRSLASEWNFKRSLNTEIARRAPSYIHILDLEFLASRRGWLSVSDSRRWFESKQIGSIDFICDIALEAAHAIKNLKQAAKKVVVLDLDNTLWGGVIGDDGVTGIELGDTAPRAEAFKDFQKYLRSLKQRGLLLAVCSKNTESVAKAAFLNHPDMVLKLEDFVSFKSNWQPKSDNIQQMALELNLGLESFVFIDDNPAEIAVVKQFLPQVSTIHLPDDPSDFIGFVKNTRLLEVKSITREDLEKTEQYRAEVDRQSMRGSVTDMASYLEALNMTATIADFTAVDVPRVSQLINKSNQFNLTTRRRTEAEVTALLSDPSFFGFSLRLEDKFGDYGLVSVMICRVLLEQNEKVLDIETFVMSCRVLERGVEIEMMNAVKEIAGSIGATKIRGEYLPTAKNELVKDLYPRLGLEKVAEASGGSVYEASSAHFSKLNTKIKVIRRSSR